MAKEGNDSAVLPTPPGNVAWNGSSSFSFSFLLLLLSREEAALTGPPRKKEFVARHTEVNSIQFQWRRRRLLGLRLLQLPRERSRFSLETAYYNPLCPLRLLPAKVSAPFLIRVRRADRSTLLAPRERRNPREKTHSPLLFSLRTPLHFPLLCGNGGTRVEAAPFIRETSPANQPPFQLEIETRSFEIPLVFRASSTSPFFVSSSIRTRTPSNVDVIFPPFSFSFPFFLFFFFCERESFVQAFCRGADLKRSLIVF